MSTKVSNSQKTHRVWQKRTCAPPCSKILVRLSLNGATFSTIIIYPPCCHRKPQKSRVGRCIRLAHLPSACPSPVSLPFRRRWLWPFQGNRKEEAGERSRCENQNNWRNFRPFLRRSQPRKSCPPFALYGKCRAWCQCFPGRFDGSWAPGGPFKTEKVRRICHPGVCSSELS